MSAVFDAATGVDGVRGFALGLYETNCYVVRPADRTPDDRRCWVADCGYDPEPLLGAIEADGFEPEVLVLTHAHPDHIAGLAEFRARFPGVPVWIHEAESEWLGNAELNLSALMGAPVSGPAPDRLIRHGDLLELCAEPWEVRHTPGHSPGGVTLVSSARGIALVGDALFAGSIGRTDFPGSNFDTLAASIREQLYTLPDEIVALPGHGPATTIERERTSNPFVQGR